MLRQCLASTAPRAIPLLERAVLGSTCTHASSLFSSTWNFDAGRSSTNNSATRAFHSTARPTFPPGKWQSDKNRGYAWHSALPQPVVEDVEEEKPAHPPKADNLFSAGYTAPHRGLQEAKKGESYMLMHPVYSKEYLESVRPVHKPPERFSDYTGMYAVALMRRSFDFVTRYNPATMPESKWLQRMVFLETVAGVPGMVAGMLRHMRSLRTMKRDHGWIHTLLEEAENERMHLLTFMELRQPSMPFRAMVLLAQGVFFNAYFLAYLISPRHCHAFVGYLEESAVHTYTAAIDAIDQGKLPEWANKPAPPIAVSYWKLPPDATMRDLLLAVRADEACHAHVNHKFSELKPTEDNPFGVGSHVVP